MTTSPNLGFTQLLALRAAPVSASSPQCITPNINPSTVDIIPGYTFHRLVIVIGSICALLAIIVSGLQILQHGFNYYRHIQRNDMRVILVIPAFAIFHTITTFIYPSFVYLQNIPKVYEAYAFVSLFQMFLAQAAGSEDRHQQEIFFAGIDRYKRVPVWKKIFQSKKVKTDELLHNHGSLRWYQGICVGLYQMPLIFTLWTPIDIALTAVICSVSPLGTFFRIINAIINIASTMTAVLSLLKIYVRLRPQLKPYHAVRKSVALKKVIGIVLLQSQVMTYVQAAHAIYPTAQMSYGDYTIGIPSFMTQCEMLLFSFVFLWAFNGLTWKKDACNEDSEALMGGGKNPHGHAAKMSFFRAIFDMLNFMDICRGMLHSVGLAYKLLFRSKVYTPEGMPLNKIHAPSGYDSPPERLQDFGATQAGYSAPTRYSPIYPAESLSTDVSAPAYSYASRDASPAPPAPVGSRDYNVRANANLPPVPQQDGRY